MPLSPLPESNTKRYFLLYVVRSTQHRMQARCADSVSDAAAVAFFQDIADTLQTFAGTNVTYESVAVAANGSNVINPVAGLTPVTGTGAAVTELLNPRAYCIAGRASSGRKTKVFLYGANADIATPATYEEDPLVTAPVQGFQGLLNSQGDFWLAIDGTKPIWYFRATVKTNDHFVDAART